MPPLLPNWLRRLPAVLNCVKQENKHDEDNNDRISTENQWGHLRDASVNGNLRQAKFSAV